MFECVHEIPPLCKPAILSESLIKPLLELAWILSVLSIFIVGYSTLWIKVQEKSWADVAAL